MKKREKLIEIIGSFSQVIKAAAAGYDHPGLKKEKVKKNKRKQKK